MKERDKTVQEKPFDFFEPLISVLESSEIEDDVVEVLFGMAAEIAVLNQRLDLLEDYVKQKEEDYV